MKRVFIGVIVIFITIFNFKMHLVLATLPELLIVEIQTASTSSASEEVIIIANTTNSNVDLAGKRIEYFSANPKSITLPSRTINLKGVVPPKHTFLLASKGYKLGDAQIDFSSTLAAAGGHLRLSTGVITNPIIYDFVGWGSALYPRTKATIAPKAGERLVRLKQSNGDYMFSGDNSLDFKINNQTVENIPITTPETQKDYSKLQLTELLPNPATPLTDADDEYIEIYNSGDESIDLNGLFLKTGKNLSDSFQIKASILDANKYLALYSKDTKLSLSNTTGMAELQTADGLTISKTNLYSDAKAAESYSFDGVNWRWTNNPTPNSENIFEASTLPKIPATKKTTFKKPKTSKTTSKTGQVKAATTSAPNDSVRQDSRPVKSSVIAGVGILGLIYGLYEYREDFTNFIHKIRKRRED